MQEVDVNPSPLIYEGMFKEISVTKSGGKTLGEQIKADSKLQYYLIKAINSPANILPADNILRATRERDFLTGRLYSKADKGVELFLATIETGSLFSLAANVTSKGIVNGLVKFGGMKVLANAGVAKLTDYLKDNPKEVLDMIWLMSMVYWII
jgi:hypothetical protein